MSEPYNCPICGQYVINHLGLEKVMNLVNGFGGKKGHEHLHKKEVTGIICNRCGNKYNPEEYYQCKICFMQCCQLCGYLYAWTKSQNTCKRCGSILSKRITLTVYDPDTGKYVRKESTFINFEIYEILEEYREIEETVS